jgi:hypothetical protein
MTAKPVPEHIDMRVATDEQLRTFVDAIAAAFPGELTEPRKVLAEVSRRLTELQHRREAEAGTQCCMCGKTGLSTIEGDGGQECELDDGRWVCSGECWDRAVAASPSSGVRVKAITWQENGATSIWSGELVFGVYYTIYNEGTGWRVFWRQFLSEFGDTEIAYAAKLDDAKEAAQAHFDAAILSVLGEHP